MSEVSKHSSKTRPNFFPLISYKWPHQISCPKKYTRQSQRNPNELIDFDFLPDEEKIVKIRIKILNELNDILNKENTRKKERSYYKEKVEHIAPKIKSNIWHKSFERLSAECLLKNPWVITVLIRNGSLKNGKRYDFWLRWRGFFTPRFFSSPNHGNSMSRNGREEYGQGEKLGRATVNF